MPKLAPPAVIAASGRRSTRPAGRPWIFWRAPCSVRVCGDKEKPSIANRSVDQSEKRGGFAVSGIGKMPLDAAEKDGAAAERGTW
jgi:hypothetical protein